MSATPRGASPGGGKGQRLLEAGLRVTQSPLGDADVGHRDGAAEHVGDVPRAA